MYNNMFQKKTKLNHNYISKHDDVSIEGDKVFYTYTEHHTICVCKYIPNTLTKHVSSSCSLYYTGIKNYIFVEGKDFIIFFQVSLSTFSEINTNIPSVLHYSPCSHSCTTRYNNNTYTATGISYSVGVCCIRIRISSMLSQHNHKCTCEFVYTRWCDMYREREMFIYRHIWGFCIIHIQSFSIFFSGYTQYYNNVRYNRKKNDNVYRGDTHNIRMYGKMKFFMEMFIYSENNNHILYKLPSSCTTLYRLQISSLQIPDNFFTISDSDSFQFKNRK